MPIKPAITATRLTKKFGDFVAVNQLSFEIGQGEIFGFLGPNGSGKSTTIRMLCGILSPSHGSGMVLGHPLDQVDAIKLSLGYMSQKFSLYDDLTVRENLNFYSAVYGVHPQLWKKRYPELIAMAELSGLENTRVQAIPGGWRQRLALAAAMVHNPPLLFLDEATSGVDPESRRNFWELLYSFAAQGITIIVTTHFMDEAEHCNRILFIKDGYRIGYGTPDELKEKTHCATMEEVFVQLASEEEPQK
jgi:ABC-2 type transport system ATP-binding protein